MPFVKTVPFKEADGELKTVYDSMLQTSGRISNVISVSSLRHLLFKSLSAHIIFLLCT